jgi:hypothetical protein
MPVGMGLFLSGQDGSPVLKFTYLIFPEVIMMNCVSCGAVLPDDARYCTECGAYLPEILTTAPSPRQEASNPPAGAAVVRKNRFARMFRKTVRYRCETIDAIDRFAPQTQVTLTLDPDAQLLTITKGAAGITLPYHQILGFNVIPAKQKEKTLFDVLRSVIGMNRRWVATLTYQTNRTSPMKYLRFMELGDDHYYAEEEKSGSAKRFEKAIDKIVQEYHPYAPLD